MGRFIGLILALSVLAMSPKQILAQNSASPPNILLIIADDMGIDASPCYPIGARKPRMPNLERMCREGLVFDNVYAAPMCSPTRATIMTGRYGFRTGVGTALSPRATHGLPLSETTIFQFLDRHAPIPYAHAVIGKWHLSTDANGGPDHPRKAGVGYYAGVLSGTVRDYFNWPRTHQGETGTIHKYITSALTDEAIGWVKKQNRPWFLWLAHVAPHLPLHVPPDDLHSGALDGSRRDMRRNALDYYFAALEALDRETGRLLASLPAPVRDNTLVMFIGDNGTPNRTVQAPYSRGRAKLSILEGGTHVPLIAWGKGVKRRGAREAALVNTTDLFATIAEAAGINRAAVSRWPEDSISFAPMLGAKVAPRREFAYVEHFGPDDPPRRRQRGPGRSAFYGWALRDARWKITVSARHGRGLFDLGSDPHEQNNLLAGGTPPAGDARTAYDSLRARAARLRGNTNLQ